VVFGFCKVWNGLGEVVDEFLAEFVVFFMTLLDCVYVYDGSGDGW